MCQNIGDELNIVEKIIVNIIFLSIIGLFLYWIFGSIYYFFFQDNMSKAVIHFCLVPFMAVLCALLMGACDGIQD